MSDSPNVHVPLEVDATEQIMANARDRELSVAKYYEANALYSRGDLKGSLGCLDAATKLDPCNAGILCRYAWIALEAKKPLLAKELYNRLIDIDPSYQAHMEEFRWDLYDLLQESDVMYDSGGGVMNKPVPRDQIPTPIVLAPETIQEQVILRALGEVMNALLPPRRKPFIPEKTRRGAPSLQALHRSYPLRRKA